MNKWLPVVCLLLFCSAKAQQPENRTVLFFFDGLRPDYITAALMPHLYAFRKTAAYGRQHHSVFPTVTRVNASSYATGSYPDAHGLMGNTVFFPRVNPLKGLSTGDAANLQRIDSVMNGQLLTAPSLGELLERSGKRLMVFSSGSTGQAYLQNHKVAGGAVINPDLILPVSLKDAVYRFAGAPPPEAKVNTARHQWVMEVWKHFALDAGGPLVTAIWLSDPDGAAHEDGIGSPAAVAALHAVDDAFGSMLSALHDKGLEKRFNIVVSADHGFITYTGGGDPAGLFISHGLKKADPSDDVVVADGAVYVKDHDSAKIRSLVTLLQQQTWAGAIFTRDREPDSMEGWVAGTLSFSSIHWNHPERAADLLIDRNWNDQKNAAGYPGMAFSKGVAGHGGLTPYEVHIALMARGPAFKRSVESDLPTSNIDIVPTLLYILHIPIPPKMEGRVIHELLAGEPAGDPAEVKRKTIRVASGGYALTLQESVWKNYRYLDFSTTTRIRQ